MSAKILWVIDPIEKLKPHKDSTVFFISQSHLLGFENYVTSSLHLVESRATCTVQKVDSIHLDSTSYPATAFNWTLGPLDSDYISAFDVVLQRREPPVDDSYTLDCKILMNHPRVLNSPVTLQAFTEKLLPVYLGLSIPTYLGAQTAPLDGVAKPLHMFGGDAVRKVKSGELLTNELFQPFVPEIAKGESRYLLLGDQLFGEILKTPAANEFRSNSAFGAQISLLPSQPVRESLARAIVPKLNAIGIFIAAIDFIGERIVEINITCPTLFSFYFAHTNETERTRMKRAFATLVQMR
jgi:glutathione synthase